MCGIGRGCPTTRGFVIIPSRSTGGAWWRSRNRVRVVMLKIRTRIIIAISVIVRAIS